jgi:molecular chaperone DnaK
MGVSVGIDLGTTFSAVAVINSNSQLPEIIKNTEGEKSTPSVIQFAQDGIKYGIEAKEAFSDGLPGCVAFFKRNMGLYKTYITIEGKEYTAEDLSGMLLKYIKEDTEKVLGTTISEAVITVPAYFYSKEREATMKAAVFAGLKVRKIINEPTAAVIAYGLNNWRTNANILVYDLGGGTFDVTLVRMDENEVIRTIATTGNRFLGGSDWDKGIEGLIVNKILEETRFDADNEQLNNIIKGVAENCKKQLSQKQRAKISLTIPDYGKINIEISRQEFDRVTINQLDQTGILCQNVLNEASITWDDISDVLLVGGSTRMPQVREYLHKLCGKPPISHVNPDEAVALGAAVQTILPDVNYAVLKKSEEKRNAVNPNKLLKKVQPAKKLSATAISKISLHEVTTHPMGIIAVNEAGTEYINELIIPANHQIPIRSARSFKFRTSPHRENEIEIYVLQGSGKPLECVIPYKYVVTGIKHVQGGEIIIRVQYSYDQNGVIHVQARQGTENIDLPIKKEPVPENMSMYGLPIDKEEFSALEPLSIIMAIDTSGSMMGEPIAEAKQAMLSFVDQFSEQMEIGSTRIGVIAFGYGADTVLKLTSDVEQCQLAISGINNRGTYGSHPLDGIKEEFSDVVGRKCAIILTDGEWFDGGTAIPAAKECHKIGIDIAAIGFGYFNKDFLSSISSSDANAFLASRGELVSTFGKIAQSLGTQAPTGKTRLDKYNDTENWDII